MGQSVKHW
jgi:hypothetical protein